MANFSDVAKSAWTTDDGKTTFCVPMASVIHGFIYNKDIFKELGLEEPKTEDEFFAVLDKIKADGTYVPLVLGTNDQWEAATMGFQNIGPNYWKGEEGRKALIDGTRSSPTSPMSTPSRQLAKWAPYLGDGYKAQTYPDSQNLFGLGKGCDLCRPARGTSPLHRGQNVNMGAFKPPVARRRHLLHLGPHRHRHRHERQDGAIRKRPRSSSTGWLRRSSPTSSPTRCRASSRCRAPR